MIISSCGSRMCRPLDALKTFSLTQSLKTDDKHSGYRDKTCVEDVSSV